jgi:hypothetical protein
MFAFVCLWLRWSIISADRLLPVPVGFAPLPVCELKTGQESAVRKHDTPGRET